MSTAPLTAAAEPRAHEALRSVHRSGKLYAVCCAVLSIAGLFSISSACRALWAMWTTDPLKSIGGLIPVVSLVLIAFAWRRLRWSAEGSWWGLLVVAATIAVVHIRDQAVLELVISPAWAIVLPPYSLVAVAYGAGVVLLFGGMRLLRAAWFPVALLWFVNPVPHFFNRHVDIPLQHASAAIARGFAHALGQPLTPDQLSLMFTPKFGMFIAPGCNGIRGAVTMGLIALVAGYIYGLRPRYWMLLTGSAVLLGYLFNFLRLCGLVVYYVIALRHPWLQDRAAMGDYVLGACLFFAATLLLFAALSRWGGDFNRNPVTLESPNSYEPAKPLPAASVARIASFAVIALFSSVGYARAMTQPAHEAAADRLIVPLPARIGDYRLQREWNESMDTGEVLFHWGEYSSSGGGPVVSLGISPTLGAHDTLICHSARGEEWTWHGPLEFTTRAGQTKLSASTFNNGATQSLESSTVCTSAGCNQSSSARAHLGFIYSRPATRDLLEQKLTRPVPVLLRVETPDTTLSPNAARAMLTHGLATFLSGADLAELTRPYRERR